MHLYSNNLPAIATISSSIMSELFPACFSYCIIFNLSQSSIGFSGKFIVEIPEAMIAGDVSNFIIDLPLEFFCLTLFHRYTVLLQNQTMFFSQII